MSELQNLIKAPWTDEQVENLKKWQEASTHPLNCNCYSGCSRIERVDEGFLIPTNNGWVCPCGKYKNDEETLQMLSGRRPLSYWWILNDDIKRVGDDMVCPITQERCGDENCYPAGQCRLSLEEELNKY